MASEIYEKVNLMLRLYEMRREEKLRKARAWFTSHFSATSAEQVLQKYPPGTEENAYLRMVITYWDMVAGIANRGLLDDDLMFENSGEAWVVWERIRPMVSEARVAMANPLLYQQLESFCARLEAWREARTPGVTERIRKRMEEGARQMAQAAKSQ